MSEFFECLCRRALNSMLISVKEVLATLNLNILILSSLKQLKIIKMCIKDASNIGDNYQNYYDCSCKTTTNAIHIIFNEKRAIILLNSICLFRITYVYLFIRECGRAGKSKS